jgi:hypothetical protein
VHACRKAGRHIVALEDNEVIFNSILKPLIVEPLTEVVKKQRLDKPVVMANSDEEEELPAPINCDRTDSVRKLGLYVVVGGFAIP